MSSIERLELEGVIGFSGSVPLGLKWHPAGEHLIYPLGQNLVVKNIVSGEQKFLAGHDGDITCVALSKDGRFIATGQTSPMGKKTPIIVWDFDAITSPISGEQSSKEILHRLIFHKVSTRAISFSYDSTYLASVGGADDNNLVIWDVKTGESLVATPAGSQGTNCVAWFNNTNERLVTGGSVLRVWDHLIEKRRLVSDDARTGTQKRIYSSVCVNSRDATIYGGTTSGDVLSFAVGPSGALTTGPSSGTRLENTSKHRFSLGITALEELDRGILCGSGDGAVVLLSPSLATLGAATLKGGVTSLAPSSDFKTALAGTNDGSIYGLELPSLKATLRGTASSSPLNAVLFPQGTSEVFVTAGNDIRVWSRKSRKELLRIQIPGASARAIAISRSGDVIVSGWSDGRIRAFAPETGKLLWALQDAHEGGVTAVQLYADDRKLITGGADRRVRLWNIEGTPALDLSFREHRKEVTSVRVCPGEEEAISTAADGSCLIWNLRRRVRSNAVFANTVFSDAAYLPDASQFLTCGSDRKVTWWDAADCSAIRILDGSTAEINSIDIDVNGKAFVTAGTDKTVKLWLYDEGEPVAVGTGHSGSISNVRISPDNKYAISVGSEGAIFIWRLPLA